ncbi:unnamed protein product [marine sediment metagenome]|uniref:Uncharacterized protein n=1 Tax=marine sediment metagenome TaxID=412755 RepID=X1T6V0_9ZZZZ
MIEKLKIEQMFAFVACTEEGEGVIGFKGSDGWMPMVGADMDRVKSLLPMVVAMDIDFKILKFEGRVDITDQVMEQVKK